MRQRQAASRFSLPAGSEGEQGHRCSNCQRAADQVVSGRQQKHEGALACMGVSVARKKGRGDKNGSAQ